MAHTKAKGTSKLGRDSQSKRLGVKISGGAKTAAGAIIIRQRGSKYYAGANVAVGGDDTLYAKTDGVVVFQTKKVKSFHGKMESKKVVLVEPIK